MKTDCSRYLNQFSIHGADVFDPFNTLHIKSPLPQLDKFKMLYFKPQIIQPTSRHLSTKPATYML